VICAFVENAGFSGQEYFVQTVLDSTLSQLERQNIVILVLMKQKSMFAVLKCSDKTYYMILTSAFRTKVFQHQGKSFIGATLSKEDPLNWSFFFLL
jgi:carbamoylphosphate synthase large subunit